MICGQSITSLSTGKAMYDPGDEVEINIELSEFDPNYRFEINFYHLSDLVEEIILTSISSETIITWQPPEADFKGYLAEINLFDSDIHLDAKSIAIDVSSDWSKFPRYGFLSDYSDLSDNQINNVMENLNRFHINGIQFYDWHWKHHIPLKGTPENPADTWLDIANRTNHFSTVKRYIEAAYERNMNTMSYNLLYGALENAQDDGVREEWYLYKDQNQLQKDFHDLSFWGHYIFVMNTDSEGWKNYIFNNTKDVFDALDFDGWHVDQLGNRGKII